MAKKVSNKCSPDEAASNAITEAVIKFVKTVGRDPSVDGDYHESMLGQWLVDMRAAKEAADKKLVKKSQKGG
jgi:hypothetical protein